MPRLLLLLFALAAASPASAGPILNLEIDPAASTATFPGPPPGSLTLSVALAGTLAIELGAPLPLSATTTFDVRALTLGASGPGAPGPGGFSIALDPDFANPGAGVLNVAGQFLIPTLLLVFDDGATQSDFALTNVTGTLAATGPGCPYTYCLETSFEIAGAWPHGQISVEISAIPEPSTAVLCLLGLAGLAVAGRRSVR